MVGVLGWFGSIVYLINHGYISVVKSWNTRIYYFGNLIAALVLVISSLLIHSYQAVVINGFWAVVSLLLLMHFDITRVPVSRRLFYVGFVLIITASAYIGLQEGWQSTPFYTALGWTSTYAFCLSYLLFCSKKISHISYLGFNFYAASALLPILWGQANWPVFTLEVCWAAISIFGVLTRIDEVHLID